MNGSHSRKIICFLLWLILAAPLFISPTVYSASVSPISDTMSRLKSHVLSDHTIQFLSPTGITNLNSQTITITFADGFDLGTFNENNFDLLVSENASCDLPGSWSNRELSIMNGENVWGVSQSGQAITFIAPPSGDAGVHGIDPSHCVKILIGSNASYGGAGTTQVRNQTVAENNLDQKIVVGGTFGDSGFTRVVIVNNDQINANATVNLTIGLWLSGDTIGFGDLSSAAVRYATLNGIGSVVEPPTGEPITVTVSTNVEEGLTVWLKDDNDGHMPGLYSSTSSSLIPAIVANGVLSPRAGEAGYSIYGKNVSANINLAEGFDNDSNGPVAVSQSFQNFAQTSSSISSESVDLVAKASIGKYTKAGEYHDSIIIVCTANL